MVSLSAVRRLAPRGDRLAAVHDRIDRLARRRRVGALLRELAAVHDLFERGAGARHAALHRRSEEHTSELQSLMRISYAVFCLKKKKYIQSINAISTATLCRSTKASPPKPDKDIQKTSSTS